MKKALFFAAILVSVASMNACKKCSTCTTTEDDPIVNPDSLTRTTEFCGRGRNYTDQVTIYESQNWKCTEN